MLPAINPSVPEVAPATTDFPTREQITRLQSAMVPLQCEQPVPGHHFAPGMYLRELTVPAGMVIVGKIHKHAHFLLVISGLARVVSEFGDEIVGAGYIAVSQPGVKRVVHAIEETHFVTVHVNKEDSQDLEFIEAEHIEPEVMGLVSDAHEVLQ